jgi:hypothetical protein
MYDKLKITKLSMINLMVKKLKRNLILTASWLTYLLLVGLLSFKPVLVKGAVIQDTAAHRQGGDDPTKDQNSPMASPDERQLLQDTGGKSGTQGIGKDTASPAGKGTLRTASQGTHSSSNGVAWIIVVLVIAVIGVIGWRKANRNRL